MLIMKKQRNLSYHISILAFLFVISAVMVTSSPFQMLLDVNPTFKSTFSFKLANAADDGGSSDDDDGGSSDDDDGGSSDDDDGGSSDDDDGGSSDFNEEGSSGGSTEDT